MFSVSITIDSVHYHCGHHRLLTLRGAMEKAMAPTPVLLLENPMDGGAWWAAVHGVT